MSDSLAPAGPSDSELHECERILGYQFRELGRLRLALRHASARTSEQEGNERLEFLGDAILGMVISEHLFAEYPTMPEGELTPLRSAVVSRATLGRRVGAMAIDSYITLGKGLAKRARIPTSVYANIFEAIVAAIWLDGGYDAARSFCLQTLAPDLTAASRRGAAQNAKSLLQQLSQRAFQTLPRYQTLRSRGPDHGKSFEVIAVIGDRSFPPAWGKSKKEAEQSAAAHALRLLQPEAADDPVFDEWSPPPAPDPAPPTDRG